MFLDLLVALFAPVTFFLFIIRSILLSSDKYESQEDQLLHLYKKAVVMCRITRKRPKVKLMSISDGNQELEWKTIHGRRYVKLITWKSSADQYLCTSNNGFTLGRCNLWATIPSELKKFGKKYVSDHPKTTFETLTLRMKQLLGLPFQVDYNYFIEFWVKPEDLFRPCFDPDIASTPKIVCKSHQEWIEETKRIYHCEVMGQKLGYPWTQLGYTYDWSSESENNVGLTEFCVRHHSTIYIEKVSLTTQYFNEFYSFNIQINQQL